MTQARKFTELRREWAESGSPPCNHPEVDKEYVLGSDTGDEGCLVCGEVWPRREREKYRPTPA